VVADDTAKAAYLRRLVRAGVSEVVTAGVAGRDDDALKAEIDVIKSENPDCRAVCPLLFTRTASTAPSVPATTRSRCGCRASASCR